MKPRGGSRASMHRTDRWGFLIGEIVEVWLDGGLYRRGLGDDAMPNDSGLGIAPEALCRREYIDAALGFEVWTSLYPRSRWDNASARESKVAPRADR